MKGIGDEYTFWICTVFNNNIWQKPLLLTYLYNATETCNNQYATSTKIHINKYMNKSINLTNTYLKNT